MQHSPWHEAIKSHLPEGYFHQINDFMNEVYSKGVVYPPCDKVFKALQMTEMDQVKVLILGQDPYHGPDQAQGLSFSVPDHVPAPPSLQNILKELRSDIGEKRSHDLTSWAEQGVLLLNACLTVPAGPGQWSCRTNLGAFHRCCDQGGQWVGGARSLYPLGILCP